MDVGNSDDPQRGYLINGRVQGVGFRHWTTRNARRLDLSGTVRNRADGRVEIHVAGDPDDLDTLEERLGEGPRAARVQNVTEIESDRDLPADFRVVR